MVRHLNIQKVTEWGKMAIFGFGGAFIIAIVSLIFNFSVSAKPLYFFLKDFFTFSFQNIINLFDKEKPFVNLTLELPNP